MLIKVLQLTVSAQFKAENIKMKLLKELMYMKSKSFISVFVIAVMFITTGFVCAKSNHKDNTPLPESRPSDISFRYHVNGGMMYYYENLYISADSSYYEVNDGGAISKTYFKMTSEQLDKLYKVFTDNEFDNITTYEEKVYDRGGENISLGWDKRKSCSISNSGMSFIDKSWHSEWNKCEEAFLKIIKDEIPKHTKDYEIRLDKSLFGKDVYVQLNRDAVIPKSMLMSENGEDEYISRIVKVTPGKHRLSINIDKQYRNFDLNADSTKGALIYFANDSLKYSFIK